MPLQILTLEPKQPREIVPYTFDWSKFPAIAQGDSITAVSYVVYLSTDNPASYSAITAMVAVTYFTATTTTCDVGSGTDTEGTYVLRAFITCGATGRKYEQEGVFEVQEI